MHRRLAVLTLGVVLSLSGAAGAKVLTVGSYHGIRGQFRSIQAAVNAAKPGDWILIGPGDYHEQGVRGASEPAGVLIQIGRAHV